MSMWLSVYQEGEEKRARRAAFPQPHGGFGTSPWVSGVHWHSVTSQGRACIPWHLGELNASFGTPAGAGPVTGQETHASDSAQGKSGLSTGRKEMQKGALAAG